MLAQVSGCSCWAVGVRRRAKGNTMERENDFSQGSIAKNILNLAVPMTLAQLINVLYSVVDRVYIGHLQGVSANALTGIGLALPIITIITAFANLFGMGGVMKKKRQRR